MKYYIHSINAKYDCIFFDTFDQAWDFVERYIDKDFQNELWVIGE